MQVKKTTIIRAIRAIYSLIDIKPVRVSFGFKN